MSTLPDAVDIVLDEHSDLAEAARDGDDAAMNRLIARVMDAQGIAPEAAEASLRRALGDGAAAAGTGVDVEGFSEYMEQLAERGDRSDWTREAYTVTVRKFADWYEQEDSPDVPPTADDVRDWLDYLALTKDLKGSTIQRHYHGIAAYFKWEGRGNELAGIDISDKYPDRSGGTADHLDWDDVEALREATIEEDPKVVCRNPTCPRLPWSPSKDWTTYESPPRCPDCDTRNTDWSRDPYDYAIVCLLSGLGIRVGELVSIDVEDCYLDEDDPYVEIERQKRRQTWVDPMPLLDDDVYALRRWLEFRYEEWPEAAAESDALFITGRKTKTGWRAHTDFIRNRLNAVAVRAGVDTYEDDGETKTHVSPHVLRHSVGTKLAQNGYNEYEVGRYLGHSESTPTGKYMALDAEALREMRGVVA